tara:strand:- start:68 stop:613 length:546 start_codon:yes stop_codon:yes gene_type:complete
MKIIPVRHNAQVIIGDYQFADKVKEQVLSRLKYCNPIPQDKSNVKASIHTEWEWELDNITFRNLKEYIREEIETYYRPGATSGGLRMPILVGNFWANVYEKGDYAQSHDHKPYDFSFAYFVKSKWYYPPLVFTDSGKRIRPKEGKYVIFPSYLRHHVPKHRYNDTRITLSGNFVINRNKGR